MGNDRDSDRTVRLRMTYHYDGNNVPSIQYDSFFIDLADKYYHRADPVAAPNAKGWKTAVVSCPRARLNGHENGESDLRIAAPDNNDIYIAEVTLEPD